MTSRLRLDTNSSSSVGHIPGEKWVFDDDVSRVFDDMLKRSIPDIDAMRQVVYETAARFVIPDTTVVDLGCAHGHAMATLLKRFRGSNQFVGIDVSEPMIRACEQRFQEEITAGVIQFHLGDLRRWYPEAQASVTLCILTLQFIPIEYRTRVLRDVFQHTMPGGALLLVEKTVCADPLINDLLISLYHNLKAAMGYSTEEIDRKRVALEGVLVPLSRQWNEELLRGVGFRHVECIWQCLNFCGWVALRD